MASSDLAHAAPETQREANMTPAAETYADTPSRAHAMANAIRFLSADAVEAANSGHPGLPMGAADIATVLFTKVMKFDPKQPHWADRDRFVLSAGHGSMLLYSALYLLGYPDVGIEDIRNFRQLGYATAGHPEYGHAAGIEVTTGPLGQGIANAVGMAMAERKLADEFGEDLVDHRTYCIVGDGCLMEGISQEAIGIAGHLKLNGSLSSCGTTTTSPSTARCRSPPRPTSTRASRPAAGTPCPSTATTRTPSSRRSRRRRSRTGRP